MGLVVVGIKVSVFVARSLQCFWRDIFWLVGVRPFEYDWGSYINAVVGVKHH